MSRSQRHGIRGTDFAVDMAIWDADTGAGVQPVDNIVVPSPAGGGSVRTPAGPAGGRSVRTPAGANSAQLIQR